MTLPGSLAPAELLSPLLPDGLLGLSVDEPAGALPGR